ncbi:MAG: AzlD domain-containing protein [Oscillospiraceae bacterium]|nr:AzlD domain-containing protein [Oscillospiraceae bacterium]MBQ8727385.1 AzlD domain-containing protein [Oscillospiraceae bacterium]
MNIYLYILVMAVTTYLVRAVPLVLMKKPIKSRFIRSFLHYVPVACLTAMTFPAILYSTDHMVSGAAGLLVGVLLAFKKQSLMIVAVASCGTVFVVEQLVGWLLSSNML